MYLLCDAEQTVMRLYFRHILCVNVSAVSLVAAGDMSASDCDFTFLKGSEFQLIGFPLFVGLSAL